MGNGEGVLVAVLVGEFHLAQNQWDFERVRFGVLHIVVRLAIFEQ